MIHIDKSKDVEIYKYFREVLQCSDIRSINDCSVKIRSILRNHVSCENFSRTILKEDTPYCIREFTINSIIFHYLNGYTSLTLNGSGVTFILLSIFKNENTTAEILQEFYDHSESCDLANDQILILKTIMNNKNCPIEVFNAIQMKLILGI